MVYNSKKDRENHETHQQENEKIIYDKFLQWNII